MVRIMTYIGLILVVFFGSALDSQGFAGWVAVIGVLFGFGFMGIGQNQIIRSNKTPDREDKSL